jgi:hypothetical protein
LKSGDGSLIINNKEDLQRQAEVEEQEKPDSDDDDERTLTQRLKESIKLPTKQFIDEIKSMRSKPNPIVVLVCGAVMESLGHMNDWKTFLKVASNPDRFIKEMKALNIQESPHLVQLLQKYIDNNQFNDHKFVNKISKAAGCLAKWVMSIHAYAKEFFGESLATNNETKKKADEYMFRLHAASKPARRATTK